MPTSNALRKSPSMEVLSGANNGSSGTPPAVGQSRMMPQPRPAIKIPSQAAPTAPPQQPQLPVAQPQQSQAAAAVPAAAQSVIARQSMIAPQPPRLAAEVVWAGHYHLVITPNPLTPELVPGEAEGGAGGRAVYRAVQLRTDCEGIHS